MPLFIWKDIKKELMVFARRRQMGALGFGSGRDLSAKTSSSKSPDKVPLSWQGVWSINPLALL